MEEQKPRPYRFTEAVGEGLSSSFQNLASETLKEGALSSKEKSIIALACAVAVKCEHCVKAHKKSALAAGASMDEILEAAAVAGMVCLGSGFTFASFILDD
ncbi:MAG: carboxymuconolactone decarboxylase family protein [Euryarchaeota archaeon]|nr:carboxymuconolactone decarboxylase family protein [Euryarchaeota archaeon]MBV1729528.1 carboxymuconolactone decarboxylase family protein [Methanobacterium sp.]MBU4547247.1 carboxymuconolactone decarboxylase family protein [Euryarchaeota archaeon]MBU4607245.1 carboxymuconolactone decarboxylase family protein [Euryarchaeota archaeon]MBV1754347.1 carboxymuconolactone decarboxylase family protein [Methanobacterium sp.]